MKAIDQSVGAAAAGLALGIIASSTYLLMGGEYVFFVPQWAEIAFYPGFLAGRLAYDLFHLEMPAIIIGVGMVGASYALIAGVAGFIWNLLKEKYEA